MGTMAHITATGASRDDLAAAYEILKEYDASLHIDADSNLLRAEAFMIAESYRAKTNGSFDPRVGKLTRLWGFHTDSPRIPSPAEIRSALRSPEFEYDFGGIGKGMAAERAGEELSKRGVRSAIINLGGNIQTVGASPNGLGGKDWLIAVVHPRKTDEAIAFIALPAGGAVATSGDYERFVMSAEGKRLHHILDPLTGMPAERSRRPDGTGLPGTGLLENSAPASGEAEATDTDAKIISVTIQSTSATTADAWSTGAFVLGWPEGFHRVENESHLEGIFVLEYPDGRIDLRSTSGMKLSKDIRE